MSDKLYIPSNFKPEWITNFIHDETGVWVCVVSDIVTIDTIGDIGCGGLDCDDCVCYSKNLRYIDNVTTLEVWDDG